MKKALFLALVLLAGSFSTIAFADKKKPKKNEPVVAEPVTKLVTVGDSISYAAGYSATDGLLGYLMGTLHVDTAYMSELVRGYMDATLKAKDPAFQAYIAGANIGSQVKDRVFPGMSKDLVGTADSLTILPFHAGFLAGMRQDTTVFQMADARNFYQTRSFAAKELRNKAYREENEAWLKNNASKPGVIVLPSGLQYKVIKEGDGAVPTPVDQINVIYEGRTIDGNVFDATSRHGDVQFDTFRCDQVIKGWTEALTKMKVGSKWEIFIPESLAYGAKDAGQIKPYSTLIFTVELVGIAPAVAAEVAPKVEAPAIKKPVKSKAKKTSRK